ATLATRLVVSVAFLCGVFARRAALAHNTRRYRRPPNPVVRPLRWQTILPVFIAFAAFILLSDGVAAAPPAPSKPAAPTTSTQKSAPAPATTKAAEAPKQTASTTTTTAAKTSDTSKPSTSSPAPSTTTQTPPTTTIHTTSTA